MDVEKITNQFPTDVKLRDGKSLHQRLMEEKDIDNIHRFFSSIPDNDKINLKENVSDINTVKSWWLRIKNGSAVTVLAEIDGDLTAEATLHQQAAGWSKHVGDIRINIAPKYRGLGIAAILCEKICAIAHKIKIEKIMAEVIPEQEKALQIFKNFGFDKEALLKDHVKDISGKKHDLIILANHTDNLIKEMHSHILYTDPTIGNEY